MTAYFQLFAKFNRLSTEYFKYFDPRLTISIQLYLSLNHKRFYDYIKLHMIRITKCQWLKCV